MTVGGPLILKRREILVDGIFDKTLRRYRWHIDKYGFVRRHVPKWEMRALRPREKPVRLLHHFVVPPVKGMRPWFKNGNKLDCRLCNIELVSCATMARARAQRSANRTGYIGVTKRGNVYVATAKFNGVPRHIGQAATADEASKMYWKAVNHDH